MSDSSVILGCIVSDDPTLSSSIATSAPGRRHTVNSLEGIDLSRVRLAAYKVTRNISASYDIAQNICAKLLAISAERRNEIECLQSYAVRAAKNEALNWRRAQCRNASLSDAEDLIAESSDPFDRVCTQDEVYRRLATLPTGLLQPFILCRVYGYDAEECAATLGISVEAVWKRVQRAFELLKAKELKTQRSPIHFFFDSENP